HSTRLITGAAVVLTLAACGDLSIQQEDELGDQYAAAIQRELSLVSDTVVTGFVTRMARRITRVADDAQRDWHFYVVNDTLVNAFAVPGGHVFVYRGLIGQARDYAELAGVVGHEIAHVTLRHSVDQMKSRQKTNVIVTVVCAFIDLCGSSAAQIAIGVGGQALFARHSREDESEADSAAVDYLARAGIDPNGVAAMFRRMLNARQESPSVLQAWFGSHPAEEDRIERTEVLAARQAASAPTASGGLGDPGRAGAEGADQASFTAFRERVLALPR
ncbi:MAG TPA: M48 family metallopeptidase, partial [Gemmatimonadaceae bacterium]|nr:M48 family metallopeptidase [Gemmatimonadaceae bacterium]